MNFMNREYGAINVVGKFVLIQKLENDDLRKEGGIYIPRSTEYENCRIGVGKILEISESQSEETGLKVGDFVMYDYHGAHNPKDENVITDIENVFMKVTEDEAKAFLNGGLQI